LNNSFISREFNGIFGAQLATVVCIQFTNAGPGMAQSSIGKLLNRLIVTLGVLAILSPAPFTFAGNSPATQPSDFSRLIGTWQAATMTGGNPIPLTWINRNEGYTTTIPGPDGPEIVGAGTFQAQDGLWQTITFDGQGDQGVYHFMDPNTVVFEGETGVVVVWARQGATSKVSGERSAAAD
jgi:hypothetical protein